MDRVARQESHHPSASDGGDFGYVWRDQFEQRVSNAIFALQPNRLSEPIKASSGYYLCVVEGKRVQPLEEVKTLIENNLRQEKLSEMLGNLTGEAAIEFHPKFFDEPGGDLPQDFR